MKAKNTITLAARMAAFAFFLGAFGRSFAAGPSNVVLGHERCGAVSAAVARAKEPGHIAAVLKAIEPAVEQTKGQPGDAIENAVRAQALDVAKQLQAAKPILADRVRSGRLKIAAARYDLDTGRVEMLSR